MAGPTTLQIWHAIQVRAISRAAQCWRGIAHVPGPCSQLLQQTNLIGKFIRASLHLRWTWQHTGGRGDAGNPDLGISLLWWLQQLEGWDVIA